MDEPFGYYDCCGMSRLREHADLCPRASAIEARRAETQSGSVHESAVPQGDAINPVISAPSPKEPQA